MTNDHSTNDADTSAIEHDDIQSLPYMPLKLNPEDYLPDLEDFDISEQQKHEMLQALWHIMSTMVDLGFGVDTVQYLLPELFENSSRDSGKLIKRNEPENPGA